MLKTKKNRLIVALILALVLLLTVVGCGKKEEPAPAATVSTAAVKSEPVKAEPVVTPVEAVKPAEPAKVVVEEPEVIALPEEVAMPGVEKEEVVAEPIATTFPLTLTTKVAGENFSVEAYDGYAYVYYPEKYDEATVDGLIESLVAQNPNVADEVGWVVEEPGMVIVAYPFGLSAAEITEYASAIESLIVK